MSSVFTIQNFFIYVFPIITLLVGWFWHRNQTKKNEITHFSINSYDVGKRLHDEFPAFQLQYRGKELSNEVHVLKGGFINSGDRGITDVNGKSDIFMNLPKGCTLKEIKVYPLNKRLIVKAKKDANDPHVVNFGIKDKFLSGDVFKYTAIIETTEDYNNLHDLINYEHRITDVSDINSVHVGKGKKAWRMRIEKALGVATLLSGIFILVIALLSMFIQDACFIKEKTTGKEVYVYITPQSQVYV